MTPKDRAKELVLLFDAYSFDWDRAKKAATACVNEIMDAIDWHEFETHNKELEYWNEVKNEISLL